MPEWVGGPGYRRGRNHSPPKASGALEPSGGRTWVGDIMPPTALRHEEGKLRDPIPLGPSPTPLSRPD